jgi:hypothetical protein
MCNLQLSQRRSSCHNDIPVLLCKEELIPATIYNTFFLLKVQLAQKTQKPLVVGLNFYAMVIGCVGEGPGTTDDAHTTLQNTRKFSVL